MYSHPRFKPQTYGLLSLCQHFQQLCFKATYYLNIFIPHVSMENICYRLFKICQIPLPMLIHESLKGDRYWPGYQTLQSLQTILQPWPALKLWPLAHYSEVLTTERPRPPYAVPSKIIIIHLYSNTAYMSLQFFSYVLLFGLSADIAREENGNVSDGSSSHVPR